MFSLNIIQFVLLYDVFVFFKTLGQFVYLGKFFYAYPSIPYLNVISLVMSKIEMCPDS